MKGYCLSSVILFCVLTAARAQFAPAAGQPGSQAIHAGNAAIIGWATGCTLDRGWQQISDTTLGKTTQGAPQDVTGPSDPAVASLGDGGSATLTFAAPIYNNEGYDFAVFENGFSDTFLELAFVEVSSDGVRFVRFPAISHTPSTTQLSSFGELNPEHLHHLAGKYRAQYGTPFDLEELRDSTGINIDSIVYIRVVDVVGSVSPAFATYDSEGNPINDPYPTAFASGGFDLDAVAVLDGAPILSLADELVMAKPYPNPVEKGGMVTVGLDEYTLYSAVGKKIGDFHQPYLLTSVLEKGVYYIAGSGSTHTLIVQ